MDAICLPGEVRRPVPGCYLPGGALGGLSVGADAGATFAGDWVVGVGAGGEGSAALEVFVDYVLRGEIHLIFFIGPIGPMGPIGIYVFWCKDRARRWRARADCAQFGDLTLF